MMEFIRFWFAKQLVDLLTLIGIVAMGLLFARMLQEKK